MYWLCIPGYWMNSQPQVADRAFLFNWLILVWGVFSRWFSDQADRIFLATCGALCFCVDRLNCLAAMWGQVGCEGREGEGRREEEREEQGDRRSKIYLYIDSSNVCKSLSVLYFLIVFAYSSCFPSSLSFLSSLPSMTKSSTSFSSSPFWGEGWRSVLVLGLSLLLPLLLLLLVLELVLHVCGVLSSVQVLEVT